MADYNEKIKDLEKQISTTKYNKKTQHAIGMYKAQLAKLKDKEESRGKGGKKGEGYVVRKTGDGTALLLGFPSVGKSTLLNALTNANSEVGAYDFTTLDVIPGLMEQDHAKIQILDVPGIVRGAASGKGRGKEVLSVMQNADLVLILIDVNYPEQLDILMKEVYDSHIRVNQRRPDVRIKKTAKDGIRLGATVKLSLQRDTIKAVLNEFKINNADVIIRSDITVDQLIDCIENNKKYLPGITILNKIDSVSEERLEEVIKLTKADLCVSAQKETGLEELRVLIFKRLELMKLWMKEPAKEVDMKEPLIITTNSTVKDVCSKLHKDFISKFKFCRVTVPSAKFPGQKLSLNHVLQNNDILELHMT